MADGDLRKRMLADLARSGITDKDAKALGVKPLSAEAMYSLVKQPVGAGYEIPYHHLSGQPLGFARYKLFEPMRTKTHEMRYWQPPKSPPHLYLPPLIDWAKVAADPALEVWVTEGEKKAASLCRLGVPCVAVSGVWAWTSKRFQQALVPEFQALGATRRPFVLCFDSDVSQNQQVRGALSALALEVERLGSSVRTCDLPSLQNQRTGLDDFLVHHKKKGLQALAALTKEPLGLSAALTAMSNELMYVEEQQMFFNLATRKFSNANQLTQAVMADRTITAYDRAGNPRQLNVAQEWIKWPQRRVVSKLTYEPGAPSALAEGTYNLWPGYAVEPAPGNVKPFLELVDYLGQALTAEQKKWWLQWMAYPLQHPGTKLYSASLVYSHFQGTGKTLLGYTLGKIYGENAEEVSQEQLHSSFNSWARCRQFIIGDEITGSDRRADADRLKHMITRERIIINEKYQPAYTLPDTCNYYLTTNQPDAVYVEATDRRYFVVEVKEKPLPKGFYTAYDRWYQTEAATAAVFHYLLHLDVSDFNPKAPALETSAKLAMHQVTGSEADGIVRELLQDPKAVLAIGNQRVDRELFTLLELQTLLDPSGRLGRLQIARALRRHGAPPPFITGVAGGIKALYAIANFDKWTQATHAERVAHYDNVLIKARKREAKLKAGS